MSKTLRRAAVVATGTALVLSITPLAGADEHLTLVADGFLLPAHVEVEGRTLHVADAFTGDVTAIDLKNGKRRVLAAGAGAAGVSAPGGPVLFVGAGEQGVGVFQATGPRARLVADLEAAELRDNPDGQPQFSSEGDPYDAVSNPYDVLSLPGVSYVADAGANAIWKVRPNGSVEVLTALPVLTGDDNDACADVVNNGVPDGGCDAVPTGIDLGPDGYLYVSGLGAEVEGNIYKIDRRTGEIVDQWSDLPPLTDVTVAPDGTIYAASLFGFQVLRIATDGEVTAAFVPFPTSVSFDDGVLYVGTAQFGEGEEDPPVGSVWTLDLDSFGPAV